MTLACSHAVALVGVEGHLVEVEADLAQGLPGLAITGLPDVALSEARDRVRAAVVNSGFPWPNKRMTIGLSPAWLPKRGTSFDLAVAVALLAAADLLPAAALKDLLLVGELGLDGRVKPVAGVLPAVLTWAEAGRTRVVVPAANLAEARLLPDIEAVGVGTLGDLVEWLRGGVLPVVLPESLPPPEAQPGDFAEVAGQAPGRFACEVAAAGGHNLLLKGTPGCGKTLLAERMPGILPPLSLAESLEVTAIHSVAGTLPQGSPLVVAAPFQAPHHGATAAAIVGGGAGVAKPGAASLAHRGVLFLDEAPEFGRTVLDSLRQPLESGRITIRRVGGTATYPARFALLLAANPCPCAKDDRRCTCTPERRRTYLARLSGPLLDRIDIQVHLPPVTRRDMLAEGGVGEPTSVIAERVLQARARMAQRYAGTPWRTNADVPATALAAQWPLRGPALALLGRAMDHGALTARGFGRVHRLAWTAADLAGAPWPDKDHVNLALGLRLGDLSSDRSAA
jgi:magnesium chelatase family protein